jgi:hypothetical protein
MKKRNFLKLLIGTTITMTTSSRLKFLGKVDRLEPMSHPWLKSCGILTKMEHTGS